MYTSCKIWKKTSLKYQFLCFAFFHNIGPDLTQILPKSIVERYIAWQVFDLHLLKFGIYV